MVIYRCDTCEEEQEWRMDGKCQECGGDISGCSNDPADYHEEGER